MSLFRTALTRTAALPPPLWARRSLTTSASMSAKHEWLVILPDAPGKLEKRMEVRPEHLSKIKPSVESGVVVMGGATLDEPAVEGRPMKINGSAMMLVAESRDEVMRWVENDVYSKSGVWDASKVQIFPFKSAVRKAM